MSGMQFYPAALQIKGASPDPWNQLQQYNDVLKTQATTELTKNQAATELHRPDLLDSESELNRANVGLVGANTTRAQIQNYLDWLRYNAGMQRIGQWDTAAPQPSSGGQQSSIQTGTSYPQGATGGSMLNAPDPNAQTTVKPVNEQTQSQTPAQTSQAQPPPTNPLEALQRGSAAPPGGTLAQRYPGSYQTADASGMTPPPSNGGDSQYPTLDNALTRLRQQNPDIANLGPGGVAAGPATRPPQPAAPISPTTGRPMPMSGGSGTVALPSITWGGDNPADRLPSLRETPITPTAATYPGPSMPQVPTPPGWQPLPTGPGGAPQFPGMSNNGGGPLVSRPPEMGLSPNGVYVAGMSGPVPRAWVQQAQTEMLMDAINGKGNSESLIDKLTTRRNTALGALVSNTNDDASWNRNTDIAYSQGLITEQERQQFYGHYGNKQAFLNHLTSPNDQMQREAGANTAGGTYNNQTGTFQPYGPALAVKPPLDVEWTTPDGRNMKTKVSMQDWTAGSLWRSGMPVPEGMAVVSGPMTGSNNQTYQGYKLIPLSALQGQGQGQGGGGQQSQGSNPSFSQFQTRVAGYEGGDAGGQNRAGSSARGTYQWMPDTWRENARKFAPDVTQGLSDQQVDQLLSQNNPNRRALEDRVFAGFTSDNAAKLGQIGVQPSAAALHLAHWFGAQGASNLARSNASTLVSQVPGITGDMMRLNGIPPNATVGDLMNHEIKRFGLGRVQMPGTGPGSSQASNPNQQPGSSAGTQQPDDEAGRVARGEPRTPAPSAPGALPPAPETPAGLRTQQQPDQTQQPAPQPQPQPTSDNPYIRGPTAQVGVTKGKESIIGVDDDQIKQDQPLAKEANDAAVRVNATMPQVYDALGRLHNAATGWGNNTRAGLSNFFLQMNTPWATKIAEFVSNHNIDPSKAADMKILQKELFTQVVGAETATGGRVGAMLTKMFTNALPNTDMPEASIRAMLNNMLVVGQMAKDYGGGMNEFYNNSRTAALGDIDRNTRYQPISNFDADWTKNPIHQPIVYEAATRILNGDSFDHWSRGLHSGNTERDQALWNEAARIAMTAMPGFNPAQNQRSPQLQDEYRQGRGQGQ